MTSATRRHRRGCAASNDEVVATKTAEQLDLQALHRVRERLVSQRTGIINQIRAFLLERGIAVRQGLRFLRAELPRILATPPDVLSPRMVCVIEGWPKTGAGSMAGRSLVRRDHSSRSQDAGCERLMSVPGVGRSSPAPWWPRSQWRHVLQRP